MPVERSVSLQRAEMRIDAGLAAVGLTTTLVRYGHLLSCAVATLEGKYWPDGDRIGCGKGYEDEARVGAKFEAYEHFFGPHALRAATQLASRTEVLSQPALKDVFPLRMLSEQHALDIGTMRFDTGGGNVSPLDFPAFLIDYTYASSPLEGDGCDYSRARRYSCGTGLAVGVDATEACVHAIGEVIERHAVGAYLARNYYHGREGHVRRINRTSLPDEVIKSLTDAEAELGACIDLFHAASDIRCPVVIARCRERTIAGLHVIGSGASLFSVHAATRAIKELVQLYNVAEGESAAIEYWEAAKRRFARWPRLQTTLRKCPPADYGPGVEFGDIVGESSFYSLSDHLQMLRERCAEGGRPVWTRILREEPAGVVLACAVMPRMERYAIAALGGVVVPCYD